MYFQWQGGSEIRSVLLYHHVWYHIFSGEYLWFLLYRNRTNSFRSINIMSKAFDFVSRPGVFVPDRRWHCPLRVSNCSQQPQHYTLVYIQVIASTRICSMQVFNSRMWKSNNYYYRFISQTANARVRTTTVEKSHVCVAGPGADLGFFDGACSGT